VPTKKPENFEYLSNNPDHVPDPAIEKFMEEEIAHAPRDTNSLAERLRQNTSASPADSGGDLDATWEDSEGSGTETVSGDNPTPDQSDTELNAQAVGVTYEDNEELEFIDKIDRRDRNRYELDPRSKSEDNSI